MPINTHHPQYEARSHEWERCRDAYDGEDAVKARKDKYLPRLSEQESSEYDAYVKRAMYYEAVGRTIDGFVGAIARKPPEIEVPTVLEPLVEDASADGISISELIKRLAIENLLQGRCALLVDYDDKRKRSYMSLYQTEAIVNWWPGNVVLHETVYEPDVRDIFKQIAIEQYRHLSVSSGQYVVTIWRKKTDKNAVVPDEWEIYGTPLIPVKNGVPLAELPFFWLTPLGKTNRIERPPLLGLVNIALSHYRNSADLEHGRHFTGLPTPYLTGVTNNDPIRIGSTAAILLPDEGCKAGYLEFTGQGLTSLERALEHKEKQMATLGAAVFQDAQRKGVEAAETARIRISGENSLLMGVVDAIEETIEAALEFAGSWMNANGSITVKLNRDFIDTTMEPTTLQGLVAAYQAGAITIESFVWSMAQAGFIPPETDLTQEATATLAQGKQRLAEAADASAKSKLPTSS